MAKKLAFTPSGIEALRAGKLADPQTPGLIIEALASGKRVWKYRRRIAGGEVLNERLGLYPVFTIAGAREWARKLNEKAEAGIDPKVEAGGNLTLNEAHALYMTAVRNNEHRARRSTNARPVKERTLIDKQGLYDRNLRDQLGERLIGTITLNDLAKAIGDMASRNAKIQANRLGAELKVFFAWATGLRGKAAGIHLQSNPADQVGELWFPEGKRDRWLDEVELPLFLRAVAAEPERHHRRGLLLLLLTGGRKMEVLNAPMSEFRDGKWIIPASRTKNAQEHPIVLAPWTARLATTNSQWLLPSPKLDDAPMLCGWYKVIERVRQTMEKISGGVVEPFTLHDLRRTMRSHIDDLVDEALAERMINHKLGGLKETYNRNKRANAMAAGFATWDEHLGRMAISAGVGEALDVPYHSG